MGQHTTTTTEELATMAAATVEAGGTVRWNHLKTIGLVGVSLYSMSLS